MEPRIFLFRKVSSESIGVRASSAYFAFYGWRMHSQILEMVLA
jgi:hypothetical protein